MPLAQGDIVVTDIRGFQMPAPGGKFEPGLKYTFTIRGYGPFFVEIPRRLFTKELAQQAIIMTAADQVELLDLFSPQG